MVNNTVDDDRCFGQMNGTQINCKGKGRPLQDKSCARTAMDLENKTSHDANMERRVVTSFLYYSVPRVGSVGT